MITTSYYVKIVYPDGTGGLEILNAGPEQIISVKSDEETYIMTRANGSTIRVPVLWALVEKIQEEAPEEVGNTRTGRGV